MFVVLFCYHHITGEGVDYDSGPYNVTFTAGDTLVSFNVAINNDDIFEGNETFSLIIDPSSLPSRVVLDTMRSRLDETIIDNDCELTTAGQ